MDQIVPFPIVDLGVVRESLVAPTLLAAHLAAKTGAFPHITHPGRIDLIRFDGRVLSIRIRNLNPYEREEAAYRLAGKPVPERVLEDAKEWQRTRGR